VRVVLALGSNLGDRMGHLRTGLAVLRSELAVLAVSPVYETDPVGGPEQGPYLNAVLLAEAPSAAAALEAAQAAERTADRERTVRWGPRTLDVDVIDAGGLTSDDPVLTLPHPRAAERSFVLAPWDDVDRAAQLVGAGPVATLREALQDRGIRPHDEAL
jgi:2-amino-4-hydroxy-6-hydroxymethyldihydropteridine diphosphokinase